MGRISPRTRTRKSEEDAVAERCTETEIDWDDVARLLSAGLSQREVCRMTGCPPQRLRAKLSRSAAFRQAIRQHERFASLHPAALYERLRRLVFTHLERLVRSGNLRVLLWVADKLKLVQPVDRAAPELELSELLDSLSEEQFSEFEALARK